MQQIKKLPSDNAFTCGKVQLYITRLTLESWHCEILHHITKIK
jgi:hypothetical protein